MFTATTISKREVPQGIEYTIEFSDGTRTVIEPVIPQDEDGFRYFVEARLKSLNSSKTLPTKFVDGEVIIFDKTTPVLTQAQIDQNQYFTDLNRYNRIITNLVEPGFVAVDFPEVVALAARLKTNFKPEYLDVI